MLLGSADAGNDAGTGGKRNDEGDCASVTVDELRQSS